MAQDVMGYPQLTKEESCDEVRKLRGKRGAWLANGRGPR